jgi:hypothetical protein
MTYETQIYEENYLGLMLRRFFFNLIKENHGSHEDDTIAEHMILTTFNEETEFLSDSNLNSLNRHYMTIYWKAHKDFLDHIEDSISHDSFDWIYNHY